MYFLLLEHSIFSLVDHIFLREEKLKMEYKIFVILLYVLCGWSITQTGWKM